MVAVADNGIDKAIQDLTLTFNAALAADEDRAADDLAYSLLQDLPLRHSLARWRSALLLLADGSQSHIDEAGLDFVTAEGSLLLCPSRFVVAKETLEMKAVASVEESLVERLRIWARGGTDVQVRTVAGMDLRGSLRVVSPDHIELQTRSGTFAMPMGNVMLLRLCRGG